MAQNQTIENENSVPDFINSVDSESKRQDAIRLVEIFEKETGYPAKMWGPAIIGFGSYQYEYASGRKGTAPLAGFSPRKQALALYFASEFESREELLLQLGKHSTAKVCVYIKKLADIDPEVLKKMIRASVAQVLRHHPKC